MQLYNPDPLVDMWIRDVFRNWLLQETAYWLPAVLGSELQDPVLRYSGSDVLVVIEEALT